MYDCIFSSFVIVRVQVLTSAMMDANSDRGAAATPFLGNDGRRNKKLEVSDCPWRNDDGLDRHFLFTLFFCVYGHHNTPSLSRYDSLNMFAMLVTVQLLVQYHSNHSVAARGMYQNTHFLVVQRHLTYPV